MNIIKPGFEEINNVNPQQHIELIARTCYKSEDKITEDSHQKIINNLYNNKHWAMLEHFIFIFEIKSSLIFYSLKQANLKYFHFTDHFDSKKEKVCYLVSCSARGILDALNNTYMYDGETLEFIVAIKRQLIFNYECYELFGSTIGEDNLYIDIVNNINDYDIKNQLVHGWHSIKFICDRGVSHEIVRHRDASFAQESTRYCNYSKNKFNNEISVIEPLMFDSETELGTNERQKYNFWKEGIEASEKAYFYLLEMGATAQEARSVLPNSLKTEIIMTAHNYEWKHFFELRCDKTAHPQMRELTIPLFNWFSKCNNDLFNRNTIKFED